MDVLIPSDHRGFFNPPSSWRENDGPADLFRIRPDHDNDGIEASPYGGVYRTRQEIPTPNRNELLRCSQAGRSTGGQDDGPDGPLRHTNPMCGFSDTGTRY